MACLNARVGELRTKRPRSAFASLAHIRFRPTVWYVRPSGARGIEHTKVPSEDRHYHSDRQMLVCAPVCVHALNPIQVETNRCFLLLSYKTAFGFGLGQGRTIKDSLWTEGQTAVTINVGTMFSERPI